MKRKRKTTLPRVTLMAFDRKALLAFSEAVEALRHLVTDLRTVTEELKAATASRRRKPKTGTAAPEGTLWDTPTPPSAKEGP